MFGTFKSHKSRTHKSYSLTDFRPGIVTVTNVVPLEYVETPSDDNNSGEADSNAQSDCIVDGPVDLPNEIKHTFAGALLKLEHFNHIPSTAINDFLQELDHLTSSVSAAHTDGVLVNIFHKHMFQVDRDIIGEITTSL